MMISKERAALKKDLKVIESGKSYLTKSVCALAGNLSGHCVCFMYEAGLCDAAMSGPWRELSKAWYKEEPEPVTQFINGCYALLALKG
jgi:hypothetical protein